MTTTTQPRQLALNGLLTAYDEMLAMTGELQKAREALKREEEAHKVTALALQEVSDALAAETHTRRALLEQAQRDTTARLKLHQANEEKREALERERDAHAITQRELLASQGNRLYEWNVARQLKELEQVVLDSRMRVHRYATLYDAERRSNEVVRHGDWVMAPVGPPNDQGRYRMVVCPAQLFDVDPSILRSAQDLVGPLCAVHSDTTPK